MRLPSGVGQEAHLGFDLLSPFCCFVLNALNLLAQYLSFSSKDVLGHCFTALIATSLDSPLMLTVNDPFAIIVPSDVLVPLCVSNNVT